jgi:hypothetical protein
LRLTDLVFIWHVIYIYRSRSYYITIDYMLF